MSSSIESAGAILEAVFGDPPITYQLVLFEHNGVQSAIFAVYDEASGKWEGIDVPPILRNHPSTFERFVQSLAEGGYTLLQLPEPRTMQ